MAAANGIPIHRGSTAQRHIATAARTAPIANMTRPMPNVLNATGWLRTASTSPRTFDWLPCGPGDRVQSEVLGTVVRKGQAGADPHRHRRGERETGRPRAPDHAGDGEQPERQQDEADHGEEVSGDPCVRTHRRGRTGDRRLVVVRAHGRIGKEQRTGRGECDRAGADASG